MLKRKKSILLLTVLLIVLLMTVIYLRKLFDNTLTIDSYNSKIEIHTLQSEYYSPVTELIVQDPNHKKVVSFIAKDENSRMHTVTIIKGKNEFSDLYLDGYNIFGKEYEFKNGIEYSVTSFWAKDTITKVFCLK